MNRVVVLVGSNIEPEKSIAAARALISERCVIVDESSWVRTAPLGFAQQPDFTNGAWLVETGLERDALKAFLRSVEDQLGRVRTANKSGPRTIDLDVGVWNGEIVDPTYHSRDFVRSAMSEVLGAPTHSRPQQTEAHHP